MTDDEREVAPWPAWVRYTVYVVGVAVVGVALVTLLYDRGVLPVAGVFAALFVAPVFVLLGAFWLRARVRRHSGRAARGLQDLGPVLAAERALDPRERPSRADDASLDRAAELAERALQQLSWGHEARGAAIIEELAGVRAGWSPGDLTSRVEQVEAAASGVTRSLDRARRTLERRGRESA